MERDPFLELKEVLNLYHKTEQELISTKPQLYESSLENYQDSYTWIKFPIPGEQAETVSDMIASGVEDFPNTCLAGNNSVRFCISGSTSLEELRTLCEQYQRTSGHED